MSPATRLLAGLVRACHPGPTVAVTTVTTLLAAATGRSAAGIVAVAAAVGTGQLSVGWSNDAHDAADDLAAGRLDKPVVAGQVTRRTLWLAAAAAATVCAVLSLLAAGPFGGSLHVLAVSLAWAYNLGIARTPASFLPYVVAFGLLPAFVTYAASPPGPPAAWAVVGFASMGLGAHLVNGVRDLDLDRGVGLDGVVVRLGAARGRALAAAAFAVAGTAVGVGLRTERPVLGVVVPGMILALLLPTVWWAPPRRSFQAVLIAGVGLVVVLVLATAAGELSLVT